MYVVATAGHVDHGKSALVRRLTGMEPDRWAEERRRGMTIDLGFAWTTLASGDDIAFVDVPGHERFVTNMLAGVGPVPAVLLIVAADEGWMPQTAEHVDALDALGVRHCLLVVTKADVADAQPVLADVTQRLAATTLQAAEGVVAVSSVTGDGFDELTGALQRLTDALPAADTAAPVRLWVDRAFTIQGAGTVVTGTLGAGAIHVGDRLAIGDNVAVVRGLQSLGAERDEVSATARVAVNLRGVDRDHVPRGTALVTPGAWPRVRCADVLVEHVAPRDVVTHVGSAAVPTRVRHLGDGAARLQFTRPLPLNSGDRLLLREPASRTVHAATVADVAPPVLARRGDAARVAAALRRGERWVNPAGGQPEDVRGRRPEVVDLGPIAHLLERLAVDPFDAPNQDELRTLDRAALAHAARTGVLLDLGGGIYVAPTAPATAIERLGKLEQPFSVSDARQVLASTRRVVVPLLEHLDAARLTRRMNDGTRFLVARAG